MAVDGGGSNQFTTLAEQGMEPGSLEDADRDELSGRFPRAG